MINKFKQLVPLCILISLLNSCRSESTFLEFKHPNFIERIKVKPTKLNFDKPLGAFRSMIIIDSMLIVSAYDKQYVIHVFNKKDGSSIKQLLQIGNGPGEFIQMGFHVTSIDKSIYVYSPGMRLIRKYNFPKILNEMMSEEEVKFDVSLMFAEPIGDRFLASTFSKERFLLLNNKGKIVSKYNDFPRLSKNVDTNAVRKFFLNYQRVSIKPDKSKFVVTTSAGAIMQIFNILGDSIILYKQKGIDSPILSTEKGSVGIADDECKVGMWSIQTTDEYIYTLYSGSKIKDLNNNNSFMADYIYIFDWQGMPVKCFEIEGGRIERFGLDRENGRIFLYSTSKEGEQALSYFDTESR